jgi:hypothetical protein
MLVHQCPPYAPLAAPDAILKRKKHQTTVSRRFRLPRAHFTIRSSQKRYEKRDERADSANLRIGNAALLMQFNRKVTFSTRWKVLTQFIAPQNENATTSMITECPLR